jgi:radical SAM superfamily enzyme YgiQ (UPF0313 family)
VQYGHDVEAVAAAVEHENARVIGVSVTASYWRSNLPLATSLCRRIKQRNPRIRTVLGGIIPTMFAEEVLTKYSDVDIVVKGEGEYAFLEILKETPLGEIRGIAYRDKDGTVRDSPRRRSLCDLDELPYAMALETEGTATTECAGLIGNVRYDSAKRSASIITSRGCKGTCTFCLNPWYYAPVRMRSIPNVAGEIRELARHGVRFLRVCDANFADDMGRVAEFCGAIEAFKVRWSCWQRAEITDAGAYQAMRRAGCRITTIGIESFDEDIRNRGYGKNVGDEQLYEVVRRASEAGIDVVGEIIIGHPEEDANRIRRGFENASRILRFLDYVNISFLAIVPHTVLWTQLTADMPARKQQWLRLRSMFQCPSIWRFVPSVDPGALQDIAAEYLRRVYHSPAYILRQFGRTMARRKRLVWFNRKQIANTLARKVARGASKLASRFIALPSASCRVRSQSSAIGARTRWPG